MKNQKSLKWIQYSTDAGLFVLRVTTGSLMSLHGIGKLIDLINGKDNFFDPFGIGGTASLSLVVIAEFFCSLLLIAGLWTRIVLIPLMVTMCVAFFIFHAKDELMDKELPLLYLISFIALFITGPGRFSVDHAKKQNMK